MISKVAEDLLKGSEVFDMHLETSIPMRLYNYDINKRHASEAFPFFGRLFGHADIPRIISGGLTGAMWSVATNVLRVHARNRLQTTEKNLTSLADTLDRSVLTKTVTSWQEYLDARQSGKHAALVSIQGGYALSAYPDLERSYKDFANGKLMRVTVVHASSAVFGEASFPSLRQKITGETGLTPRALQFIRALNRDRIFVDFSHMSERSFWQAIGIHDKTQPPLVTHTSSTEAHAHWRGIDDRAVKAIADRGGVVGVIWAEEYLGYNRDPKAVLYHMDQVIRAGGEDVLAIGSDLDGFITPPRGLRSVDTAYLHITDLMLRHGYSETRVQKILGLNFLDTFKRLRP